MATETEDAKISKKNFEKLFVFSTITFNVVREFRVISESLLLSKITSNNNNEKNLYKNIIRMPTYDRSSLPIDIEIVQR